MIAADGAGAERALAIDEIGQLGDGRDGLSFAQRLAAIGERHQEIKQRDQEIKRLKEIIAALPPNCPTCDLERIVAEFATVPLASNVINPLITPVIEGRLAQLRSIGKDAAAGGVARILAKWEAGEGAPARDGAAMAAMEAELVALRRENADLHRRNGALENRMAAIRELSAGSDDGAAGGSDDDLIDEDVNAVLV